MNLSLERATVLGTGVGLTVGSLAMWHTDPTTAAAGTTSGLLLLLFVLKTATRVRHRPQGGSS